MAYKIVNEWKSKGGEQHEITIYKYNYTKDEMVRYTKENGIVNKITYLPNELKKEVYYGGN